MSAKTISILLLDGSPLGVRIADIGNTVAQAIAIPRKQWNDMKNREELSDDENEYIDQLSDEHKLQLFNAYRNYENALSERTSIGRKIYVVLYEAGITLPVNGIYKRLINRFPEQPGDTKHNRQSITSSLSRKEYHTCKIAEDMYGIMFRDKQPPEGQYKKIKDSKLSPVKKKQKTETTEKNTPIEYSSEEETESK